MTTLRADRMIQSAPSYYETSVVYENMQQAQADEYDALDEKGLDLQAQLTVATATWGLRYWEEALGITIKLLDSYVDRRGRVTAKLIGAGNFSARHIYAIAAGYNAAIRVSIDVATFTITVTFLHGMPTFLEEFKGILENILHAHLGVDYKFEWYLEGTIALKVGYVAYVYDFPIVGIMCGQWPRPIDQAYVTSFTVAAKPTVVNVVKVYQFTNMINASEGGLL